MTYAENRAKWERMGLCSTCGGLRLELEWKTCAKCRKRSREKMRALYWQGKQPIAPEKPRVPSEIRKDHKCWYCEWRKFEGDRFFCPFAEGTCMKDGTVLAELVEEEKDAD